MQVKNINNPFQISKDLWQIEFELKYKFFELVNLIFEEDAVSISGYEIFSNTIEADPEDIWKVELIFDYEPLIEYIKEKLKLAVKNNLDISIRKIEHENWVENVDKNFKPIFINDICIVNNNKKNLCPDNFIPIIIDSSMAFGTGEHHTTSGCIEYILNLKNDFTENVDILDVGTGTGILSIISKKIWNTSNIIGIDIDQSAVDIAKQNAVINNVDIDFFDKYNLNLFMNKFDLIYANILANPIIEMSEDFYIMLKKSGKLLLSGYIDNQKYMVHKKCKDVGFKLEKYTNKNNWIISLFSK